MQREKAAGIRCVETAELGDLRVVWLLPLCLGLRFAYWTRPFGICVRARARACFFSANCPAQEMFMGAKKLNSVLPASDLDAAVAFWSEVLGVAPTFVDGDRWAQFDLEGSRLALAGKDRVSEQAGVMVKVDDLVKARTVLVDRGQKVSEIEEGPHELRCATQDPDGSLLVLYQGK